MGFIDGIKAKAKTDIKTIENFDENFMNLHIRFLYKNKNLNHMVMNFYYNKLFYEILLQQS